jgi:phage tail-like protein
MAQTGQRVDPFFSFNFIVEIDQLAAGSFTECSGLGSTTEIIEFREGAENTTVRKLMGKSTFTDITLKYGMTNSTVLWDWRQRIVEGNVDRRNGAIIVFDGGNHLEVARWNFYAAWPTKFELPHFNAKGADIAIQTLVLANEGLSKA